MARPVRLFWVTAIGGLLILSACAPPGVTLSTGPRETTITGRFGGQAQGDGGCAWLETSTTQRIEVTYPNGWHIEFDPLALYDEAGRQRAKGGYTLTVEGYYEDVGASVCQPQRMFAANDVKAGP